METRLLRNGTVTQEWACKSVPEQILMLSTYRENAAERLALGIPPLPLEASQAKALTELLENPPSGEEQGSCTADRTHSGVDEAAYVKATWLSAIAQGQASSPLVSPLEATRLLGTMVGGYNVAALIELLQHSDTQWPAAPLKASAELCWFMTPSMK